MIDLFAPYNSISIIGMDKNVGKTTLLNHLIKKFSANNTSLALTSIGLDGEDVDLVVGNPKPRIYVPKNTVIATAEGLLAHCDITLEVEAVTPFHTPLGRIVIIRGLSAGYVQLAGPSMVSQMAKLVESFDKVDKIIIDGAISRKTFADPAITQSVVLCTGAALAGDMDAVIAQTRHAVNLLTLQKAPQNSDIIPMEGAVSEGKIKALVTSGKDLRGKTILADDPTKILITAPTYEKLKIKGATLAVKNPVNLVAVAVNPFSPKSPSFPAEEFLEKMRNSLPIFSFAIEKFSFAIEN